MAASFRLIMGGPLLQSGQELGKSAARWLALTAYPLVFSSFNEHDLAPVRVLFGFQGSFPVIHTCKLSGREQSGEDWVILFNDRKL